jgi:UDP-glucose 4-epimerase
LKYLITGGAGFIGSHLADSLIARGDEVALLDDLSTGSPDNVAHLLSHERVAMFEGTIMDEALVRSLVDDCDVVVHLAASVGVHLIIERPLECLINNIRGTEVVLEACADRMRKVLVASTSEIYGKNGHGPMHEDSDRLLGSPFKTRWSYSTSKAVDEILAYSYWRVRGMPSIVARLFNSAGPRQTGAYGMVIPRLVRQALSGEPLTIYGDGTQSRCFCHVHDTVDALVALLDHPGSVGDVFNIGAQNETTINDLARLVLDLTRSESDMVHIPYDVVYEEGFEDMHRRVPDIGKIERATGWSPSRSLEQIVTDVLEHERLALVGA